MPFCYRPKTLYSDHGRVLEKHKLQSEWSGREATAAAAEQKACSPGKYVIRTLVPYSNDTAILKKKTRATPKNRHKNCALCCLCLFVCWTATATIGWQVFVHSACKTIPNRNRQCGHRALVHAQMINRYTWQFGNRPPLINSV